MSDREVANMLSRYLQICNRHAKIDSAMVDFGVRDGAHPWQSAKDDFDTVLMPMLEKYGLQIGADASSVKNPQKELATEIIDTYVRLRASFDPMTAILLKDKLGQWIEARGFAGCHTRTRDVFSEPAATFAPWHETGF